MKDKNSQTNSFNEHVFNIDLITNDPKCNVITLLTTSITLRIWCCCSGGQWNSGGQCDHQSEPIKNEKYLTQYPPMMKVVEKVVRNAKTPVSYLNITRLTDYRKDGHPSMYRKKHMSSKEKELTLQFQDCSHWCLPGVPDLWNEILYAELLRKQNRK